MKTVEDQSYGIVPMTRQDGEWEVLLIHQISSLTNDTYWVFPKGHPEKSENGLETAARELKEETGLDLEKLLVEDGLVVKYHFKHNGTLVKKTVTYYIGQVEKTDLNIDTNELVEAGWYSLADANKRLTHQTTKGVLSEAAEVLENLDKNKL